MADVPGANMPAPESNDARDRLTPVLLIEGRSENSDRSNLQGAEADEVWGVRPTRWEALTRIQSMLQLKSYIDEQAAAVVLSLARTIEARDSYTRDHSERLATSAVALGVAVGLSDEQVGALRIAGIVHDVGKVVVPDAILSKPGPLTPEEAAIMRKHPAEGERICSPLKSFRRVLPIIRHHHERMDGSGYPDGLRGNAIPLSARILQIVDIYDALTTDRPYRLAFTPSQALATLYSEADRGWLDIELVRIFAPVAALPKSTHSSQVPARTEKLRSVV